MSPGSAPLLSSSMSALFSTTTTFLPHSVIFFMNTRSLSEIGRSVDVTKSSRSQRGTMASVISACAAMMAFVPGVSTSVTSSSHSTGSSSARPRPCA